MSHLIVSEAARLLKAKPRDISDLFYGGHLDGDVCPLVGGRRLIPRGYLAKIQTELKRRSKPVTEDPICA